ncbi:beta-lactamase family protein [Aquincola sp. S2]|uniref:Beta-lactamase family protein n=1 Tax=Pseudaquabacterium terrae TaxID=2732868 RepID=A0ABX2ECX3_9BURK|nr:serine hydrolase domain-containing protein [Aquabacterium terrae]NRF65818.1 beta-lactamase family protein [Aquabacterium terrae]
MPRWRNWVATLALCCSAVAAPATEAGFAPERLERLSGFLQRSTAPGGYMGVVALIARDGRIVFQQAHGHRDLARSLPMQTDSIFRIRSMSKLIATVAVMMLVEEGRLGLDDPVARYLPAFARSIAVRHLLTHTAGFALEGLAGVDLDGATSLREYADRVARVPLGAEPGTRFAYDGVNTEVACRLVEVVAKEPFDRFVQQRILGPLGMVDTGFEVPPAQRHRIVELTMMGADDRLQRIDTPAPGVMQKSYPSGAGGLYSTAADYARFAQMLLNGGTLDGVQLLGRKTVELMMRNHLSALQPPTMPGSPGEGFGLGGSVLLDPAARGRLGSIGQFGWTGSATTWFTLDREERLVAILLMQHLPSDHRADLPRPYAAFQNLVYQALRP